MKRLVVFFIILMAFLMVPFSVLADGVTENKKESETSENADNSSDSEEKKEKVNVYFFHGDGCPHCADAKDFFDSIEDEYGHLFELVSYETWKNADNADLLEQVGEVRDEEITGVPYILIGNKSFSGYRSDFNDDIIEAIENEYEVESSKRYDIMDFLDVINDDDDEKEKEKISSDILSLIIILATVGAVVTGIVFARKNNA